MGSTLGIRRQTFIPTEDHTWLKTNHGLKTTHSITLWGPAFAAAFPTGFVPSSTPLAKISSGTGVGYYGLYDTAGANGLNVPAYLLATSHQLVLDDAGAFQNTSAAGMWEGDVKAEKMPASVDADFKTAMTHINFAAAE